MYKLLYMLLIGLFGCSACFYKTDEPYIRTQPQIEYCGNMCHKLKELNCTGYFEDIEINCSSDPIYKNMEQCKNNSGIVNLSCEEFCIYEMKNSVPLNPKCLSDNLSNCNQIENICK